MRTHHAAQTPPFWLTHVTVEASANSVVAVWGYVVEERNAPADDSNPYVDTVSSDGLPFAASSIVATASFVAPLDSIKGPATVRLATER